MTADTASSPNRTTPQALRDWWFRDRESGRIVVGQLPGPAIWVWLATVVGRMTGLSATHEEALLWLGRGALTVWGIDELLRGVNPFRRLLGAAVLVWQLVSIGLDLGTN